MPSTELNSETSEKPFPSRKLESLDDIPREIADRRIHAVFGDLIASEKSEIVREKPDVLEKSEEFVESAKKIGLQNTEGVLGYSTKLEEPAHILKGDVGTEIATLIHEDLHRLTHPETMREMTSTESRGRLYEGITEHLTEKASAGLHGFRPGEVYQDEVHHAEDVIGEIGEQNLRDYFFKHEFSDDIQKAIERLSGTELKT
jgi:hypothetical protein